MKKWIKDDDEVVKKIVEILREDVVAEYDAIMQYERDYNDIKFLADESGKNYSKLLNAIQDIINEEKKHVGEFNEMIKNVYPEENDLYESGKKEVVKLMRDVKEIR